MILVAAGDKARKIQAGDTDVMYDTADKYVLDDTHKSEGSVASRGTI